MIPGDMVHTVLEVWDLFILMADSLLLVKSYVLSVAWQQWGQQGGVSLDLITGYGASNNSPSPSPLGVMTTSLFF